MVRISGNLRVRLPPGPLTVGEIDGLQPEVLGFSGECHIIEFSSSIVEISASYTTFTIKNYINKETPCSVEAT